MIRRLMCMIGLKPHVWELQTFEHMSLNFTVDDSGFFEGSQIIPMKYEVLYVCKYCHKIKDG